MKKLIRPTYPKEFSIGLLILVFVVAFFLSHQIFDAPFSQRQSVYAGMFLVAIAVIIMLLIIWEEILFPIKIKEIEGGMVFRNHGTKLKTQLLIYSIIPIIFVFIYFEYEIKPFRFIIWAAICTILPIVEKIASGVNNYNDFLKLSDKEISYKNNEKSGVFETKYIQSLTMIKDERNIIEKIELSFSNSNNISIDLDEMELDAYYAYIEQFIITHYSHLLKK